MSLLIKQPLNLGAQVFRINRADMSKGGVKLPGWWEAANCREYGCGGYLAGWTTTVDPATDLGREQARLIRSLTNREFREDSTGADGLMRFHFPPGQKCFNGPHQLPVQREPRFKNIDPGRYDKVMDYDEFFDTMNETVARIKQLREG